MRIGKQGSNDTVLTDIANQYGSRGEGEETTKFVVKTSFYPREDQLDKLDDLATEYNKKYRRQRKKIDRQDIIRFLIDHCTLDSLNDLTL